LLEPKKVTPLVANYLPAAPKITLVNKPGNPNGGILNGIFGKPTKHPDTSLSEILLYSK